MRTEEIGTIHGTEKEYKHKREQKKNRFPKKAACCATEEIRTLDTRIFSPLLYRLSYSGN